MPATAQPSPDDEGSAGFFEDKARGWFWYEQQPEPAADQKAEKPLSSYPFPPPSLEEAQRQLKDLKERAVMKPTEPNMVAYIRLQNWVNDKSEEFSDAWKTVLWSHPELDYSLGHPVNAQAILVKKEEVATADRIRLADVGRTYGLFFIFRSDCPYCHKEAPMLKRFAASYGISVIPISQDGLGLPDYPDPRPDSGISAQFGVPTVPALFLVNPAQRHVIPVAYGLVSERELVHRIVTLTGAVKTAATGGSR